MANEYHDAQGRFCSKSDMQNAIQALAASGDHGGAQKLIADLKALEEQSEKKKFTAKVREDQSELSMMADGTRVWYQDGVIHRIDGPAVERKDGAREWYIKGRRHRVGGPALERPNGAREWWVNAKRHREDGPALERPNGTREWWVNGFLHRTDGPAVERADGSRAWWVDGEQLSETEFKARQRAG